MGNLIGAFPSLHPLVVHFPVVLLIAAPFLQIGGLVSRKPDWILAATLFLVVGITCTVFASYVFHAEPFNPTPEAKATFLRHEAFAAYTLWAALGALVFKLVNLFRRMRAKRVEVAALGAMLIAAALVAATGHLGAELTHIFHVRAE